MRYVLIFIISCIWLAIMQVFCKIYFKDNFEIIWYGGALQVTILYFLIQIMWNKIINEILNVLKKITKKEKNE